MAIRIRAMTPDDWPDVRAIYEEGMATGDATFETVAPAWDAWDASHLPDCRLVAMDGSQIVGWAALSAASGRCVYAGVGEVSVYVAAIAREQGIGGGLLEALIAASEKSGLWTLQAGIFPENLSSVSLHQRYGFRFVGKRERLGQLHGRWRDVLLFERRSEKVGR